MALVDYKGFRLIAISTLPVSSSTLCYGTCDGGQSIHGGTGKALRSRSRVTRARGTRCRRAALGGAGESDQRQAALLWHWYV
jgi:hypothetical protein